MSRWRGREESGSGVGVEDAKRVGAVRVLWRGHIVKGVLYNHVLLLLCVSFHWFLSDVRVSQGPQSRFASIINLVRISKTASQHLRNTCATPSTCTMSSPKMERLETSSVLKRHESQKSSVLKTDKHVKMFGLM